MRHRIPLLRAWDVEMWSNINPGMIEWLESIHSNGTRTALLSNMHMDMVSKVVASSSDSTFRRPGLFLRTSPC